MKTEQITDANLKRARRRVKAKLGWLIHATVYVGVNFGLWMLALIQGHNWNKYPLMGWGLGLLIHGLAVLLTDARHPLKETLIQRELARIARNRNAS